MTEESSRNNEMCWVPRFPKQCVSAHSCGEIWATGTASAHASAGEFVEGVPHTILATVRARGSEHDGRHGDSAAEQGETPPRIVLRFIAQRNYPRSMVFSDVFSTRFPASKVPPPRDSRGNEHANGKRTPDAMKETRRDHGSARVSASAASAAVSRSAENSYAAPTRTSQPGDVAEEGRAEAERGGHGADVLIARADPTTTIDPSSSQIVAPLPASIAATLTEHKPGVYAYGNDEMGYFYIPAEDVPVARAYVESGGTESARSSLTNSPMNPRAALGFSPSSLPRRATPRA